MNIKKLFELTLKNHWQLERYKTSGWRKEVERLYYRHIDKKFGSQEIDTLSAKDIRNWHRGLADTPIAANRALNVLSKMFSYAEEQELVGQNQNPCKLVRSHCERKRKRFATPAELKRIDDILKREADRNPRAVAFIYLLIYSGARPRAIERAKWEDLTTLMFEDEMFGLLTFSGKTTNTTGEDEQIVIPPQALNLILRLNKTSPTILGVKMPKDFWNKVRVEAGCPDLWARDLRRTFATIGLSNGQSSGVIGELLNHKSASTTKIYTQLIQTKKIETTKEIAKNITDIFKKGA